jgi:general secretion pathway protein D
MKNFTLICFLSLFLASFSFSSTELHKNYKKRPVVAESSKKAIDYQFQAIALNELTRLVFSQILKTGYVADDDFLHDKRLVSLSLPKTDGVAVQSILYDLIKTYGYTIENKGSYANIFKPLPLPLLLKNEVAVKKSIFTYAPRHRSVDYLAQIIRPFFKDVVFSFRSDIATAKVNSLSDKQDNDQHVQSSQPTANLQTMRTLAYQSTDEEHKQIIKIMNDLDVAAAQIFVKANVYEVTTTKAEGSAFSLVLNLLNSKVQISTGSLLAGSDFIKISSSDVQSVFSLLDKDNRFNAVSTPSLRVADSMTAKLSVGAETPILGAISYDKNGTPVQSVEYKNSGIILQISPEIRDQEIQLQISQQISNFITTTNGVNSSPTLIKREINSNILVQSGEIVILGGLVENKDTKEKSGFSFLPNFFGSKANENIKTEILIVLQATKI